MGFLDRLLGRKPVQESAPAVEVVYAPADTLTGIWPSYSEHNRLVSAWDCDIAWQCLDRIVREVAKTTPSHVVRTPDQLYSVNDDIQKVLRCPNEIMTAYDMTSKVLYTLYTRGDAFIFPVYEGTKLYGLYPVIPQTVDWLESDGELWVRLNFANGKAYLLPYFSVIHIRRNYGEDEYMGTVRETPLLSNMQLNEDLLDSVRKGVNSSALINGVVKYGTALSRTKMEADVAAFSASLKRGESGILPMDNQSDYHEIKRDVKLVDADTLKYVQSLVLNHFGMSANILNGTASKSDEELWYHGTIQPLLECLGQAYSRVLFSANMQHRGHAVEWFSKSRSRFMTGSELVSLIKEGAQVGAFMVNEIRDLIGLAPLTDEEGGNMRPMSLNFIDATKATEYQLESVKNGGKTNEDGKTQDE